MQYAESAWISAYEEDLMQYLQLVLINLFLTNLKHFSEDPNYRLVQYSNVGPKFSI